MILDNSDSRHDEPQAGDNHHMIEKAKSLALTLAGVGLLLLGLSAAFDRYEIAAAGTGEGFTQVYRLDKRTGEVCVGASSFRGMGVRRTLHCFERRAK